MTYILDGNTYAWGSLDNLLRYIKCYRAYNISFTEG